MLTLDDIIEYVIYNEFISLRNMKSLLFVNKSIHTSINDIITLHCSNYSTKKTFSNDGVFFDKKLNKEYERCKDCRQFTKRMHPLYAYPLCKQCSKKCLIHKTTAKKKYNIKDKDLKRLDFHCYHMSNYKLGYVYDLHSILYIHCINSIIDAKKALCAPKKISKKVERESKIRSIITKEYKICDEDEIYHILSSHPIFCYINNGSYGIKKTKLVIQQWIDFYNFILTDLYAMEVVNDLNINDYFDKYILDKQDTINKIYTKYEIITASKKRENQLMEQLIEYGIVEEYKCSAFYDYISGMNTDLEFIVEQIREHHFFVCHTNYIAERTRRLYRANILSNDDIQNILTDADNISKKRSLCILRTSDIPDFIRIKYLD